MSHNEIPRTAGRRKIDDPETSVVLSDEQMEDIAERAATKAVEKMVKYGYQAIGKSVVEKMFYLVGLCAIGAWLWAKKEGYIK